MVIEKFLKPLGVHHLGAFLFLKNKKLEHPD